MDTVEAGTGDVDVTVTCSSGHVMVKRQKIDEFRQKFTFVPSLPASHDVNVTFNKQQVVGIYLTIFCYSDVFDVVLVGNLPCPLGADELFIGCAECRCNVQ